MPSNTIARGNELVDAIFALTVTPPATITTATGTQQTLTVLGAQVGDVLSWNLTTVGTNYNALLTLAGAYVSALNTIILTWTTEGATISTAGAQTVLFEYCRPENFSLSGIAGLPTNML
jgi:hypothetical protein